MNNSEQAALFYCANRPRNCSSQCDLCKEVDKKWEESQRSVPAQEYFNNLFNSLKYPPTRNLPINNLKQSIMTEATKVNELQYLEAETTTLRAYYINTADVDFDRLNKTKPDFVHYAGKSSDPEREETSFLIQIGGAIDGERDIRIRQWLNENV